MNQTTEELLVELARTGDPRLRDAVIERHETLVRGLARRFARRDAPAEDLAQVAWLALIRAVDRVIEQVTVLEGVRFSTYAVHCMVGGIRHYLRDHTRMIRLPRRLGEIGAQLTRTESELVRRLGRKPTIAEMAAALDANEEELMEAMEARHNPQPASLDQRNLSDDGNEASVADTLGKEGPELDAMVEGAPLRSALAQLDPRDRLILRRRFYDEWTQKQVANTLRISQMQVSRLERRALGTLRELMARAA